MKKTLVAICALTMSLTAFADSKGNELVPATAPAQPETPAQTATVKLGDVDGDGALTDADAEAIAEYILRGTTPVNLTAADVNGDKLISISDIAQLYYIILNDGKIRVDVEPANDTPVLAPERPAE